MSTPPHDPLIGSRLDGRYRVSGVLGRGGMGVVYEGVHEELGRAVAIKVLFPNTATDAVVVERFVREARVASGLAHGNIVEVSDLGRLPDGRPYLVMPKVHGVDFATLLARERWMAPARVVSLLRGVAAALDLVHAEGLVHRDVKPENLMHVVRADGSENVLLMDFGIAALLGDAARLTEEGMRCGTPAYMAPEFVATGEFDRRADVYALATVAFEMLTGELPFDDAHALRIMHEKTSRPAPSLSAVSGTRFDTAIERVIARGLMREPMLRYPSTGEFIAALEQAVLASGSQPIAGDAPTVKLSVSPHGASTIAPLRRARRVRIAALVGVCGALLVALALFAWRRTPPASLVHDAAPAFAAQPAHDIALPPSAVSAPEPAALPTAAVPLVDAAAAPTPALTPTRTPARRAGRAEHVAREAAPNEPPPASLTVTAAPPVDADRTAVDADRAAIETLKRAADRELLQGHLARAVELFERAIAQAPDDAAALRGLGVAQERLGHSAAAVRAYRRALELEPEGAHSAKLRARLQRLSPE